MRYRIKMLEGGRISIPKALREEVGCRPGTAVKFTPIEDGFLIERVPDAETAGDKPPPPSPE